MASWERANSIVRFLSLLDDETSEKDLLPFETATRYVSHTPRLSNTFLLSLSFVARDRNTREGYKFNFIPRLNIIPADIYGKYHAIVCCVTIEHRFIILTSRLILDVCCSKNVGGSTALSTEISPMVNNSMVEKLILLKKKKEKAIPSGYTCFTKRHITTRHGRQRN